MTRTPWWEQTWSIVRLLTAGLIAAAVIAQAQVTIGGAIDDGRDVGTTIVNFFSFFTILSNVSSAIVLAWAAVWLWTRGTGPGADRIRVEPTAIAVALACVSTYMIVTGIVYNTLLRHIELPQGTTVPWSNEILHVVGPAVLLLDVLLGPRRRALGWGTIGAVVVFPIVWVGYTLVRGPLTVNPVTNAGWWYPYPFLDPNVQDGYAGVAVYVVGIAAAIAIVAWAVVGVGRRRGAQPTGSIAGSVQEPSASAPLGR